MGEKHYAHFLSTTEFFKLDSACFPLWQAFQPHVGVYLVGSVLKKRDWRDVDVRVMLDDEHFDALFSKVDEQGENPLWKMICVSVSSYLSSMTNLPIDFQIQRMTNANQKYPSVNPIDGVNDNPRNAIGMLARFRFE